VVALKVAGKKKNLYFQWL